MVEGKETYTRRGRGVMYHGDWSVPYKPVEMHNFAWKMKDVAVGINVK